MGDVPPGPAPDSPSHDDEMRVEPVRSHGRTSAGARGPLVLAIGIVGVLGASLVLAQLFPDRRTGPLIELPTSAPETSPSPSPAVASPADVFLFAPRLGADELVARVQDGGLEGFLVYADARLRGWCQPEGATTCAPPALAIDGLPLDVLPGDFARRGVAAVPDDAQLVLVVRNGQLEYLGSLVATRGGSPALETLVPSGADPASPEVSQAFRDVRGWLVVHPACITTSGGEDASCPPAPPFLADDEPLDGGILRSDNGSEVGVAPGAWGLESPDVVTEGPFLVREAPSGDATWQVVARYDPSRSVRVVIP